VSNWTRARNLPETGPDAETCLLFDKHPGRCTFKRPF
jgi:hypothetical protein